MTGRRRDATVWLLALFVASSGCDTAVPSRRDSGPAGRRDASTVDAAVPDSGADATTDLDASIDGSAPVDSGSDAEIRSDSGGSDAGADACAPVTFWIDEDGDGFGGAPATGCTVPAGAAARAGDCDDGDPDRAPDVIEVCGNRIDDDCSGTTDEAGCSTAPHTPTRPWPWSGWRTGSVRAAATRPGVLHPTFSWRADGAHSFDVQLDGACNVDGCAFTSPTVRRYRVVGTRWTVPDELDAARTAPVGHRYWWRVRACVRDACSAWSAPRYVDVGRAPGDFDGDGYSDLAIGAPWADHMPAVADRQGAVFLYAGGPTPAAGEPVRIDNPTGQTNGRFGYAVASGDLDGDRYDELIVGAYDQAVGTAGDGAIYVFAGSPAGIGASTSPILLSGDAVTGGHLGYAVSVGDLDGDGRAEIVGGAPDVPADAGTVYVYAAGRSSGRGALASPDGGQFGQAVSVVGDVDGDGLRDLVIGAPRLNRSTGRVYVFRVPVAGAVPWQHIDPEPGHTTVGFGTWIGGAGDVDGDGLADLALGAFAGGMDAAGAIEVHTGSEGAAPVLLHHLEAPGGLRGAVGFGVATSLGDFDGDGLADLAAGAYLEFDAAGAQRGAAHLFRPGTTERSEDVLRPLGGRSIGDSVLLDLDTNGDGLADLLVGAPASDSAYLYLGTTARVIAAPIEIVSPEIGADFGR